ncbi:MAG: nuclear transport factor 2 family protein [Thiohalocapsa sp.]|nr:nuclear transport factor 2 family protein [Thiohalocapsa sp.]MCF7991681.1 nuclear transport factor 2 family protein [Thiohalocapsa sp.]
MLDTPDEAETAFYSAFEALDLASMGEIWHDEKRTRCIHPGGDLLEGYGAVMESWRAILGGAQPPVIRVRLLDRLRNEDIAIHLVEERIGPSGDAAKLTRVLATNGYLRTPGGWRLFMHHASLPLVGGEQRRRPERPASPSLH